MKEAYTTVTRKGQITLPVEIRQALNIKEGDKISVSVDEARPSLVILRPVRSVAEMTFGAITPRSRPEDFEALREAFEAGVAEDAQGEDTATKS